MAVRAILTLLRRAFVVLKSLAFLFGYMISPIRRKPANAIVNAISTFISALQGPKVTILSRISFVIGSLDFLVDGNNDITPARALLIVWSSKAAIE